MKVAICAIAKNENLYIHEWITYHLNLGFTHIFIYDNNDLSGERISDVVNNENVTIIECINERGVQSKVYTTCFNKYKNEYDWFLFLDIDEFLVFENKSMDVISFLKLNQFERESIIRLNWMHFTDNDSIDVINDNYKVLDRFKTRVKYGKDRFGKSFVKNTVNPMGGISAHGYCSKIYTNKAVNVLGEECLNEDCHISKEPLYKIAWVNHYRTKTIGEYIRQKWFRGDASTATENNRYNNLDYFFETNKRTKEKEEYAIKLLEKINNGI